jgi:hypothetical protein
MSVRLNELICVNLKPMLLLLQHPRPWARSWGFKEKLRHSPCPQGALCLAEKWASSAKHLSSYHESRISKTERVHCSPVKKGMEVPFVSVLQLGPELC